MWSNAIDTMFKRIMIALALLGTMALPAKAQLLWRIDGNGLPGPSYVFGTYHYETVSFCDSIPGFNEAFHATTQLFFETVLSDVALPGVGLKMMPEGQTLNNLYTKDEMDDILEMVRKYTGVRYEKVTFTPGSLTTFLRSLLYEKAHPESRNPEWEPMEITLQKRASTNGQLVSGLETLEFQMDLLHQKNTSLYKQATALLAMARNPESDPERLISHLHHLRAAYRNQDLETLGEFFSSLPDDSGMETILDDRNERWIPIITEAVQSAPSMIIVGAGHLVGENGILSLLKKEGYLLSPIQE